MARIRVTFFFKQNKYGWTETYWYLGSTLSAAYAAAGSLAPFRMAMCGIGTFLQAYRVSDDEQLRDSQLRSYAGQGLPGTQSGGSDIPNTALLVFLYSTELHRGSLYMRGIPDDVVTNGGVYTPTPAFNTAANSFRVAITSGVWAINNVTLGARHLIATITQPLARQIRITTLDPHGLVSGDIGIINGPTGTPKLNGRHRVIFVDDTTLVVVGDYYIGPYIALSANIRKFNPTLYQITACTEIRATHRIAGRPFDSPRGRRRTARAAGTLP